MCVAVSPQNYCRGMRFANCSDLTNRQLWRWRDVARCRQRISYHEVSTLRALESSEFLIEQCTRITDSLLDFVNTFGLEPQLLDDLISNVPGVIGHSGATTAGHAGPGTATRCLMVVDDARDAVDKFCADMPGQVCHLSSLQPA